MATGTLSSMSNKQNKRLYVGNAIGKNAISYDPNAYSLGIMACPYPTAGTKTFLASVIDIGIIKLINQQDTLFAFHISNSEAVRITVNINTSNNTVTLNTFTWFNTDLSESAQIILYEVY